MSLQRYIIFSYWHYLAQYIKCNTFCVLPMLQVLRMPQQPGKTPSHVKKSGGRFEALSTQKRHPLPHKRRKRQINRPHLQPQNPAIFCENPLQRVVGQLRLLPGQRSALLWISVKIINFAV